MKYFATLLLSLFLTVPLAANAQAGNVSEQDTRFLQAAASSGLFEMEAGQLAIQIATQERIKEFARMMLVEHEIIDGDLKSLAMMRAIELPINLEGEPLDTLNALQQDSGAAFDKRYVEQVAVDAHTNAVALFADAAEKSDDDEIKAFAGKALKTLQQHLQHAQNLKAAAFP